MIELNITNHQLNLLQELVIHKLEELKNYDSEAVDTIASFETIACELDRAWMDNGYRSVRWHVDDFEHQAAILEDANLGPFDSELFEDALESMIDNHDASIGINWDTITHYLLTYCKKEKNE